MDTFIFILFSVNTDIDNTLFQTGVDVIVDNVQHTLKGTVTLVPGDNLASQWL